MKSANNWNSNTAFLLQFLCTLVFVLKYCECQVSGLLRFVSTRAHRQAHAWCSHQLWTNWSWLGYNFPFESSRRCLSKATTLCRQVVRRWFDTSILSTSFRYESLLFVIKYFLFLLFLLLLLLTYYFNLILYFYFYFALLSSKVWVLRLCVVVVWGFVVSALENVGS